MAEKKTLPEDVQERIKKSAQNSLNRVSTDLEGKTAEEQVELLKSAYLDLFESKETYYWFRLEHANTSSNEIMLEMGDKLKEAEKERDAWKEKATKLQSKS